MNERRGVEYDYEWTSEDGVNISHFWVPPENRGQGLGEEVLWSIIEELRAEGAEFIVVNMGGGAGAGEFLRKQGFERVEETSDHVTYERDWADE